jgi:rhodanese-related sulfurtransferase
MNPSELFLYALLTLVGGFYVRRIYLGFVVRQYSPTELAEKLRSERNLVLLDVRTKHERSQSSIKGSLHIPLNELRSRSGELEQVKNNEIVCYCQTGKRSLSAAGKLRKQGFNVANLKGGIAEWNFLYRTS